MMDFSRVECTSPGGMGTEGSVVLGMYSLGSIVTNVPGGFELGLMRLVVGSIGSGGLYSKKASMQKGVISSGSREMHKRDS